ncbi:helix-turn-helix domain-containing protein [Microbacterium maritypicum]|uniref:helix-turn-helix domain-containing protein n=1 Tax=Microbacterium maritypicum TaxID=33918 RepID=UPI00380FF129
MSLLSEQLTVGERMARARRFAGLEQAEMAEHLNRNRNTISAWERGVNEPPFSAVVAWARLTGQPVEWFAGVNAETPSTEAEGVSSLSQHSVRPKGLEPLTF